MWPLTATTATPRPVETIAVSRMMVIDHHLARGPNGRPARRQRTRRKPYADSTERPNVPTTPANQLGMAPRPPCLAPAQYRGGRPRAQWSQVIGDPSRHNSACTPQPPRSGATGRPGRGGRRLEWPAWRPLLVGPVTGNRRGHFG